MELTDEIPLWASSKRKLKKKKVYKMEGSVLHTKWDKAWKSHALESPSFHLRGENWSTASPSGNFAHEFLEKHNFAEAKNHMVL